MFVQPHCAATDINIWMHVIKKGTKKKKQQTPGSFIKSTEKRKDLLHPVFQEG